ncbi:MAG TPA: phosphate/phosphite/phosphonate ABC transporter substrate-binding protein [Deinococcales bacterium]|nr:phosphate/phosphite/phosphonate ABC transporter substrate-binding protein [Deinococcales bacterium]
MKPRRPSPLHRLLAGLAALALGFGPALAAEDCARVRLGLPAGDDPAATAQDVSALGAYLKTAAPGLRVTVSVDSSSDALGHALTRGTLDAAWLTAEDYVATHDAAPAGQGITAILKALRGGQPGYWSAFIVRSDSRYTKITDLKGARFAWTDSSSAAGYQFPRATLLRVGLNPEAFFSRQSFVGGHDAALLAVLNGAADAAATFAYNTRGASGAWSNLLNPAQAAQLKVIGYSPMIPYEPVAARDAFLAACPAPAAELKRALAAARYYPAAARALRSLLDVDALAPAVDGDYDTLRDTLRLLAQK